MAVHPFRAAKKQTTGSFPQNIHLGIRRNQVPLKTDAAWMEAVTHRPTKEDEDYKRTARNAAQIFGLLT
jgi:hypothetical protein